MSRIRIPASGLFEFFKDYEIYGYKTFATGILCNWTFGTTADSMLCQYSNTISLLLKIFLDPQFETSQILFKYTLLMVYDE